MNDDRLPQTQTAGFWLFWLQRAWSFDGLTWIFGLGLVISVVQGLNDTVLFFSAWQVHSLGVLGWLLATIAWRGRYHRWIALFGLTVIGGLYLILFWTPLTEPVGDWLMAGFAVIAEQVGAGAEPDSGATAVWVTETNALRQAGLGWQRRVLMFSTNPAVASQDSQLRAFLWGALIWMGIIFLAWMVWQRRKVLPGILPLGSLLVLAVYFTNSNLILVAIFLVMTLLLHSTLPGAVRVGHWRQAGLKFDESILLEFHLLTVVLVLVIGAVGYTVPAIASPAITGWLHTILHIEPEAVNRLAANFGLNVDLGSTYSDRQRLPRIHLLGNNPDLDTQIVFQARFTAPNSSRQTYWRALIYQDYDLQGWHLADSEVRFIAADESLLTPPQQTISADRTMTQHIRRGPYASDVLYTSGVPLTVNQSAKAYVLPPDDLIAVVVAQDNYTVTSQFVAYQTADLRQPSPVYPQAIADRYLGLPDTLPPRVRDLAYRLTAQQPTTYDKALALQDYLRSFPYDLDVPSPPADADVADYFLFELQRGYCDYYATSMVVMARAVGIPARFVVGYIGQPADPNTGQQTITRADAHAWPQLYFPQVGWVNFEPTAGRPTLLHTAPNLAASGQNDLETVDAGGDDGPQLRDVALWNQLWAWGSLVLVFIAAMPAIWWFIDRRRWQRLPPMPLSQAMYHNLRHLAERVGFEGAPGLTPYEFVPALQRYLDNHPQLVALSDDEAAELVYLMRCVVETQFAPPTLLPPGTTQLWVRYWFSVRGRLRRLAWRMRLP